MSAKRKAPSPRNGAGQQKKKTTSTPRPLLKDVELLESATPEVVATWKRRLASAKGPALTTKLKQYAVPTPDRADAAVLKVIIFHALGLSAPPRSCWSKKGVVHLL